MLIFLNFSIPSLSFMLKQFCVVILVDLKREGLLIIQILLLFHLHLQWYLLCFKLSKDLFLEFLLSPFCRRTLLEIFIDLAFKLNSLLAAHHDLRVTQSVFDKRFQKVVERPFAIKFDKLSENWFFL